MELTQSGRVGRGSLRVERIVSDFGYGFATAQDPAWTLSQVLLATGGRFIAGSPHAKFRAVCTDSRTIEAGDLFVALQGERFDGSAFVTEAVRKGAAGIVVDRVPEPLPPVPVVLVEDPLRALGDLASYRRAMMRHLKVLAITGSSGKTTVKEMTARILGVRHRVLKTEGNFNNLVGLPLSLLPVDASHEMAVLEMGMNRPGEIARLTEIADPDIACILNVQEAHLAGLDDAEGVARAKGELFDGVKTWATLVVNYDDKRVRRMARRHAQPQIGFGRHRQAQIRATHIHNRGEEGMAFTLHVGAARQRVRIRGLGEHNVLNSLAAAALAYAAGARLAEIVKGLEAFEPFDKRLEVQRLANGLRLVNDSYNANPASMLAALETVHGLRRDHRAVVVLGDMLELGRQSVAAHRFVGETVARLGYDQLLAVGQFAQSVVEAAIAAGMPASRARRLADKEEVVEELLGQLAAARLGPGDWVLIKGSRGMRMETIASGLMREER